MDRMLPKEGSIMHYDELTESFCRWVAHADTRSLREFFNHLNQLDLSTYSWKDLLMITEMIDAIENELSDRGERLD
jgi:hypothetical protein